jgi:hypothetical protein
VGLTAQSKQAALEILEKPKASAISRGVPKEVLVASRPGDLEGVRVTELQRCRVCKTGARRGL